MENRFEKQNKEKMNLPKLKDLINTELPEDVKSEIAGLVFEGKSEKIAELIKIGREEGKVDDVILQQLTAAGEENFSKIFNALVDYFNEKICPVLEKNATEFLQGTQLSDLDSQSWHDSIIKEEAQNLLLVWMKEVVDLAGIYEMAMNRDESGNVNM